MRLCFSLFILIVFMGSAIAGDRRQKIVNEAISESVKVIDLALQRNSPLQEVLIQMRESFSDVRFLPWGQDFPHCKKKEGVRAFVTRGSGIIRLCDTLFTEDWDKHSLSQILLHEAAHVAGIHDECLATKYEVGALKLAKKKIAFENDYWKQCQINRKFDPFQIVTPPVP